MKNGMKPLPPTSYVSIFVLLRCETGSREGSLKSLTPMTLHGPFTLQTVPCNTKRVSFSHIWKPVHIQSSLNEESMARRLALSWPWSFSMDLIFFILFLKSILRIKQIYGLGLKPDKKPLEGKTISFQRGLLSVLPQAVCKSPWPSQPLWQLELGWEVWGWRQREGRHLYLLLVTWSPENASLLETRLCAKYSRYPGYPTTWATSASLKHCCFHCFY